MVVNLVQGHRWCAFLWTKSLTCNVIIRTGDHSGNCVFQACLCPWAPLVMYLVPGRERVRAAKERDEKEEAEERQLVQQVGISIPYRWAVLLLHSTGSNNRLRKYHPVSLPYLEGHEPYQETACDHMGSVLHAFYLRNSVITKPSAWRHTHTCLHDSCPVG